MPQITFRAHCSGGQELWLLFLQTGCLAGKRIPQKESIEVIIEVLSGSWGSSSHCNAVIFAEPHTGQGGDMPVTSTLMSHFWGEWWWWWWWWWWGPTLVGQPK